MFQNTCLSWSALPTTGMRGASSFRLIACRLRTSGSFCSSATESFRSADEVHGAARVFPRPGEVQEVSHELVQPVAFPDDNVKQPLVALGDGQVRAQQLHRAAHGGQGVADLVRNSGGHPPDGRHPVLDPHLLLEPLDIRQVLERDDVAEQVTAVVHERRYAVAEVAAASAAQRDPLFVPQRACALEEIGGEDLVPEALAQNVPDRLPERVGGGLFR